MKRGLGWRFRLEFGQWSVRRGASSPSLRLHWPSVTAHCPLFSARKVVNLYFSLPNARLVLVCFALPSLQIRHLGVGTGLSVVLFIVPESSSNGDGIES